MIDDKLKAFLASENTFTSIIDMCEWCNVSLAELVITLKRKDDIGHLARMAYNKVLKPYLQPNNIQKNLPFIDWSFKVMGLPTLSDSQR